MEEIKGYLECSSLPGLYLLVKSKHFLIRFIWLITVIISIGICIKCITNLTVDYYNYEVITNIKYYNELESQFPAISFCIITNKINDKIPLLNEIILFCTFNLNNCTLDQFELYVFKSPDTIEYCYRFNSGKNYLNQIIKIQNSSRFDPASGLLICFNLKGISPYDILEHKPYKMSVHIQNATTIFRRDQAYNLATGLQITSGIHNIQIEREFIQKLPFPYNQCVKQDTKENISNLFQYFIENNKTYLQKDCIDLCIEEYMINNCSCKQASIGSISICLNDSLILKCIENLNDNFIYKIEEIPKYCFEKCPYECDYINYRLQQTYLGQYTDNERKNDLILLDIYYPKLIYTLVDQINKIDKFQLVANIGGIFGLFIGINFFTLVEIIEILLQIILNYIHHNLNNRKINLIS
jgi:hypothetical protein